ncbi:hypothetical protein B0H17DRAFT_1130916 [Mycena rosella]|uniref:Uncharacterized protein n=1 Tax=Mycena rosella TaxID=1033263 RepID=A0AAD7DPS8_MYCRO|nr:hypothetical protein B0H17DRAFT_1130916 [Mycena rosella]
MPPVFCNWSLVLSQVNHTQTPNTGAHYYMYPEPALLFTLQDESCWRQFIRHYELLHNALLYRLGTGEHGKVTRQGTLGMQAEKRSADIADILGLVLRVCGIDDLQDFPVDPARIPPISSNCMWEILWEISEINFQYKLWGLDLCMGGCDWHEECLEYVMGETILDLDLSLSKQGLAATAPRDHLSYLLHLAKLMQDWSVEPNKDILIVAECKD